MDKTNVVTKAVLINATPDTVWKVITDPVFMKRWMSGAEINVISEWLEGTPIVFQSNVNGKHEYKGTIIKLDPPDIFRYSSWSKITRMPDVPENYSIIELRLIPDSKQTRLEVTHSNLIAEAAVEHSAFYWNVSLDQIRKVAEDLIFQV